jgi:hypothetical protein
MNSQGGKMKENVMSKGRRIFTNEFKLGDEVSVIRHRHGWEDGGVVGVIVELSEFSCVVQDDEGEQYEIRHCRDIRL